MADKMKQPIKYIHQEKMKNLYGHAGKKGSQRELMVRKHR